MRTLRGLGCLVLAAAVWLASLHLWFRRTPEAVAAPLAARQLALWQGDSPPSAASLAASLAILRNTNPEWDLMARMFAVLAFANLALREPARRGVYLATIDAIIERTLADEARGGAHEFLLPYGRDRPFRDPAGRSLFVDGELALMIAARDLVAPGGPHDARPWIARVIGQLERGPVLLGESYPDEVWLFCNTVALAAIRLHDVAAGAPDRHAALFARWIASAGAHVVDPATGLLVAKTTLAGAAQDGPEGSTLWLAATMLLVVDEAFAREQYGRARIALRGSCAGFGWAREWPRSWVGPDDVDSGPTVPIVGASAGSSGLALVAAAAFGDDVFTAELIASLGLAGFPVDGGARYAAGNQLADAVILFALASGPLWERAGVRGGGR